MVNNENSMEKFVLSFINDRCIKLKHNSFIEEQEKSEGYKGTSLKKNQIPYNMEKDIDRLCFSNAIKRFLNSGRKEDAFDIYFCYLEMFIGDYEKTRRMIELLSEFEANGSGLLMKHRDHYSHSVYVFCLGLAIYESNEIYRKKYNEYYKLTDEHKAAHHFLKYWGLASLFHDIGYPFELPFEQVCSYFEVEGDDRKDRPFIAYKNLFDYIKNGDFVKQKLNEIFVDDNAPDFITSDELFAYVIHKKFSSIYNFTYDDALSWLRMKPSNPDLFNHFMDHAYFSCSILFERLYDELKCDLDETAIDALTAILIHNSMFKFKIEKLGDKNLKHIPLNVSQFPIGYLLMLCDELQCWDRTAYGRNSKTELHPMDCKFEFTKDTINAVYIYDKKEEPKIEEFINDYNDYKNAKKDKEPKLKAYASMYKQNNKGVCEFQEDIERIVDLTSIKLKVSTDLLYKDNSNKNTYLSDSNFINLYNFAVVLNGRYSAYDEWKNLKTNHERALFIKNPNNIKKFTDDFKNLSLEYKISNINQAKAFAEYMNAINCFYTNKQVAFEMVESFNENDLIAIGKMEHKRWLFEKYNMGWQYGEQGKDYIDKNERELVRKHPDMIPNFTFNSDSDITDEIASKNYARLDKGEQDKDVEPMVCMLEMLKMFDGLRIYKFK